MKLREQNVFSRVCLSVCLILSVHRAPSPLYMALVTPLYRVPAPLPLYKVPPTILFPGPLL